MRLPRWPAVAPCGKLPIAASRLLRGVYGVAHGVDDDADDDDNGIDDHDCDRIVSDDVDDEVARCIILQGSDDRMGLQRWPPNRFVSDCVPGASASRHGSRIPRCPSLQRSRAHGHLVGEMPSSSA